MDKETLRMQMLSGIITESEYVAKLAEIEAKEKESLNEHYVAGGIVGIGAINQIPPREKTDYENAFEHFLGQKYDLNEVEDDMPKAPSHEETDAAQVYEEEVEEAMVNPNTSDRVSYLESALDHVWNMGKNNNSIDFEDLAQSIVNDMFDDLEEGKEVDESDLYEEELDEAGKPGTFKERSAMAKKARAGKDIGEKGKNFEKIAKSASKKYGSEEAGKKVAGAVMYGKLNK